MLTIKILGVGCANCKQLEKLTRKVVGDLGIEAEFIKVTDYGEIMTYDVLATPGLVLGDEVVSSGRIPSRAEISTWVIDAVEKKAA